MQLDQNNLKRFLQTPLAAWVWFILTLLAIGILTTFGPAEHSLGTHIRIVYLHGAWVWASLAAFLAAAIVRWSGITHPA